MPVPRRIVGPDATPVELGALVEIVEDKTSPFIFRRDGSFADMVLGDMAGRFEAPIYGMGEIQKRIDDYDWQAEGLEKPQIRLHGQPIDQQQTTLLWDGEWEKG